MTNPPLHIAIIGDGAAGYFAAIEAKRNCPSADITIFEKNQKMLAKVEITGGGRCNLTNSFQGISDAKQAYPRGHKLMKRLFKRFDHRSTYQWFERGLLQLMGTVVEPVVASIPGTKFRAEGPLLITHWGMSGPAALKLSSHAARHLSECGYQSAIAIS